MKYIKKQKMPTQTEVSLTPKWIRNQEVQYEVYRKDHFSYAGKQRYPIENAYPLRLKVLKVKKKTIELEAHYPLGYLYLLTSFQPFNSLIGKEELFQSREGNRFVYVINKDGSFKKMKGLEKVKEALKAIASKIKNADLKKKERKRMLTDLSDLIKSKKDKKDYLSRDIKRIHRYYGNIIPVNYFYNNASSFDQADLEKELHKLKGKAAKFIKLATENYQELDFVNTFQTDEDLIVEEISGLNLISVAPEERHDLSQLIKAYLDKRFKIEDYHNITLHQGISSFNLKNKHLTTYTDIRRTISDKMQKIEEVKMKMVKDSFTKYSVHKK